MGYTLTGMYVGAEKVRPPVRPWTPDPTRTILYMRFNNNLNDDSGNNHTSTGAGIGYGTIGNNYYVEKTSTSASGTYIHPSPASMNSVIGSGDYTVSLFAYNVAHTDGAMVFGVWNGGSPFPGIYITVGNGQWGSYNINNQFHNNPSLVAPFNQWTYITVTRVNGMCYRYANGVLMDSYTDANTPDFSQTPGGEFYVLNRDTYSGHSWGSATGGKVSELIFEKVGWSADEVATYFSQQKGNYGL